MSRSRGTGGSINFGLDKFDQLKGQIESINAGSQQAIQRTVSDFSKRAPAWISKAVTSVYNIKPAEVKGAMKGARKVGSIKVSGIGVDNIQLIYKGRRLTPSHFGMKPKTPPSGSGTRVRKGPDGKKRKDTGGIYKVRSKSYTLRATIIKGRTAEIGRYEAKRTNAGPYAESTRFVLMPTGTKGGGAPFIPFQRRGAGHRPGNGLQKMLTLSVPQMIQNKDVAETIRENIDEGLMKRLENHVNQALKQQQK